MQRRMAKRRNVKSGCGSGRRRTRTGQRLLSETEIAALLDATKAGRHGVRDHLLVLMMYRHGLRVSEAVSLRLDEVDVAQARLWVRRLKNGLSVEQPIARRRTACGQAVPRHRYGQASLAVHLRTRAASRPAVRVVSGGLKGDRSCNG